jgi:hypothetical protein
VSSPRRGTASPSAAKDAGEPSKVDADALSRGRPRVRTMSDRLAPLKDWSDDDPEQGHHYVGLRVTMPDSATSSQEVLVQPNIPDRAEKLAEIARALREEESER